MYLAILLLLVCKWFGLSSSCFKLFFPSSTFLISSPPIIFLFFTFSILFVFIDPDPKLFPCPVISSSSITVLYPPLLDHHLHSCHHRNHYSALISTLPFLLHFLLILLVSSSPVTAIDPWLHSLSSSSSSSPWSSPPQHPRRSICMCWMYCTL